MISEWSLAVNVQGPFLYNCYILCRAGKPMDMLHIHCSLFNTMQICFTERKKREETQEKEEQGQ